MTKSKLIEIPKIVVLLGIWLVILVSFGCATYRLNFVKEGAVTVETVNSKDVRILDVGVYQKDGRIWVDGHVKGRGFSLFMPSGYVQVEVISPDGKRVKRYVRLTGRYGKVSRNGIYVTTEFPHLPSDGSLVRVSFHRTADGENFSRDG